MIFNKYLLSILSLIILFFFVYNSKNFQIDASSDTLISQSDKDFQFFNYYNEIFPSKNFLVLAIKSNNVINEEYIKKINQIKNKLKQFDKIESIFSIVDAPILLSNNIKLNDLTQNIETINNTKIDLNIILEEFVNSPLYSNQIISKNKKISSMIIYLKEDHEFNNLKKEKNKNIQNKIKYRELKKSNNQNRNQLIKNIRHELDKQKKIDKDLQNNLDYFLGGIDMIIDDTITYVKKDIIIFAVSVFIFIFIVLFIIFKDLKWVIIPILSTLYSITLMIGLMGLLNWEVTAISANFISLMLILSISMCIHIINNYRFNFNNNFSNPIKITLNKMFWPCLYTSLTTIVAFSSLLFSDIKPIIDFGKIMIVALSLILLCSFTILPLLIYLFPSIDSSRNVKFKILNIFYKLAINYSNKILIINILIFIISLFGIYNLNVENSFINYFKQNTQIHQGMKTIDENLGGTTPLDIIIQFNEESFNFDSNNINIIEDEIDLDEIYDDELNIDDNLYEDTSEKIWFSKDKISTIETIHKYLESKDEIGKVQSIYSLIDIAEQINQKKLDTFELSVLYNKVPENYKEDLIYPYLSINENMIKISARVKDSINFKRKDFINEINNYISNEFINIKEFNTNGLLVLYNNMLQSLFSSQIKSLGFVVFAIFIMFLILFKSFKISILGIIPNIVASGAILGSFGLFNIPLDIMTVTIAAITIGIAVDNTIHYLYRYKENLNNDKNIQNAINLSHNSVGYAVLTTSLTIAFGFSALALSNFIPTILFGIFTSFAMLIAMIGVLLTLPSLINIFNK